MLFRHTRVINRHTDSKRVLDRHAARQTRHTNKNARQTDILTRVLDTHISVPYINSGRHIKRYRDRHRQTGTET